MSNNILAVVVLISLINSSDWGFTLKRQVFSPITEIHKGIISLTGRLQLQGNTFTESLNLDLKSISELCFFPLSSNQTAVASWAPEPGKARASGAWWKHMDLPERLTDALKKKGWSKFTAGRDALKWSPSLEKRKIFQIWKLKVCSSFAMLFSVFCINTGFPMQAIFKIRPNSPQIKFYYNVISPCNAVLVLYTVR